MLKPVLQLAAVGIVGIGLWKIASVLLVPLLFLVVKIGLIVGLVMLAFWYFNRKDRRPDTPPASE